MNSLIVMMLISGLIRGGGIRHDLSNLSINHLSSHQEFELFCFSLSSRFGYLYWIAFSAISFERGIATYFVQDYEKRFTSWTSQVFIITGIILFYGLDLLIENFVSPFALIIFSLAFHMIFNFIAIPIIHRINLRYVDINSSLSRKFTVAENVKATRMIFPIFIIWLTKYQFLLQKSLQHTLVITHLNGDLLNEK
ncbi:hypothetical protein PRIPAC_93273 [Pristionchus pacificus]|uniref:G protein-coupled receptor n=1 Tax=Pristionchus pacificus TaxID=54126 RepID=A0A2A6B450_PRIPA|nr:hypothetical protein PRIPAC_93273 [Pristionchus pacificus]|eukprot:PDM60644.1 G protein-coupled receptor [Pristionchus pacificus]